MYFATSSSLLEIHNMNSNENTNGNAIQSTRLMGHRGPVLCMDYSTSFRCILSGSEDGTARLWDLRSAKATTCIVAGEEVTACAFGPPAVPTTSASEGSEFSQNFTV